MSEKKPRVLMLGPGRNNKGGIASVINQYYDAGLQDKVALICISTASMVMLLKIFLIWIGYN